MPSYTFYDEKSGIEWTESLSIAERTKFLDDNKQIRQVVVPVAVVGDHVMGVGPKTDGGFEERMSQIANAHPGSPLASKYKSNESHAKIKARSIIDKHKKKKPFVS
tara:strand:+ start:2340 stop:2657 length:318 start_codon:yes stop_codon:yes gene_type:complete